MDMDQTVALGVKPPAPVTPTDVLGPITSLAQMQYWAAQGQKAAADAASVQQQTLGNRALLGAKQGAVTAIQGGATPEDAINKSGLGVYDPTGSTATLANVTAGNTIKANRAYAAQNPDNPMAIAGPEAAAKGATAVPLAQADVQKATLANAQSKTQLFGQIGTMMASDPSPQGRAQAAAFAQQAGAPPQMIQQFMALPDDQYVSAGKHFQQAALTPEKYFDVSGQSKFNQGVAEGQTTIQKTGPGETLFAGPASGAAAGGRPVPTFSGGTMQQGATAPAAPQGVPAAAQQPPTQPPAQNNGGPNYYGVTFHKEGGGSTSIVNPTTGAGGAFQFTPPTWAALSKAHPELNLSPGGYKDPSAAGVQQQIAAMKTFTQDNASALANNGVAVNDKNLYMAHFLGAGGASEFIKAGSQNPDAVAAQMFPAAAKANPTIFYANGTQPRTLSQVYSVLTKGYGDGLSINAPGAGSGIQMAQGAPLAQPGGSPPPPGPQIAAAEALAPPPGLGGPQSAQSQAAGPVAPPGAPQPTPSVGPTVAPVAPAAPAGSTPLPIQNASVAAPAPAPQLPIGGGGVQGPAAPATTAGGMQVLAQGMSRGALSEQEAQGQEYGKLPAQLDSAADAAKTMNANLDEMEQTSKSWTPGKWASVAEEAREGLQSVAKGLGVNTPELDQKVGDFQSFNKLAYNLPRQAARELGSRTGVQELQLLGKSFPGPEMSGGGMGIVIPQLKGLNDFTVAKQQAAGIWKGANNNSLGPLASADNKDFQTFWNDHASPVAFIVHRMSQQNPAALQAALTRMKDIPGGTQALNNIIQQTKWASEAGLLK